MKYLSVCSGIEAATVAWKPLGWEAVAFSEIERFPSSVLAHHYPSVPNLGDMNDFQSWPDANVDVLVGGTPCQSFSVAGLRQGLADPRGNLALVYLALADRYRPRWLVWENVPGVLSSDGGRDFGSIVGAMVELGYGFAYRVLDAQYFGVPQRRRRVFVVGHLGDWRRAAAVLFEPESLRRNPPPSREAGQVAPTVPSRSSAGGGLGTDFDCDGRALPMTVGSLCADSHPGAYSGQDAYTGRLIPATAHSLRGEGFDAGEDGTGRGTPLVAAPLTAGSNPNSNAAGRRREDDHNIVACFDETQITSRENRSSARADTAALAANARPPTLAFANTAGATNLGISETGETPPITTRNGDPGNVMVGMAARRLTPLECERLQGFPDGYTDIPGASDSARYKALGNSMAVPVMRWIGKRLLSHRDHDYISDQP